MDIRTGYPDIPIEDKSQNRFKTDSYVEALSEFILECDTPMTIAIQGDWGTGKTSMINLVEQRIKGQVFSFTFNTWQYSQFDLGNDLPALLLNRMARELAGEPEGKKRPTKTDIANVTRRILKATIGLLGGFLSNGNNATDDLFEEDMIRVIEDIHSQFQQAIIDKAKDMPKKRVVVFVDDLDRLEPEKAVEILEVLKLFLDCRQCVFVLAVDYSVVTQGVRAKYGEGMDEEKGRSFFDKIIQLPFKMPVARYDIKDYLKDLMRNIWGEEITEDEQKDVENYLRIIENTIGKNPRSIKRIVNSFTIVEKVANLQGAYAGKEGKPEEKKNIQKLLFALLCIQLAWEDLYNYLIEHSDSIDEKNGGVETYVENLRDDEKFEKILSVIYPEKKILRDTPLFKELDQTIEIYCDWVMDVAGKDENGADEVLNVLQLSSITANSDTASVQGGKKTMDRDSFFAPYKNNKVLSWMIEEAARLEEQGMQVTAYRRDKSDNYLRFTTSDIWICDCIAATRDGWKVYCYMEESNERKEIMKKIESVCGDRVKAIKDHDKSWFVVLGVKEKEVFEKIIDTIRS